MWPWEHLAVGYCCYSLLLHVRYGNRPTGPAVLVLAFATQLPDLVDKPLGWWFGVLPSVGLAHSLLVAIPTILLVWALSNGRIALPFGVGYLAHLAGDVVYPVFLGGTPDYVFLVWPLVGRPTPDAPGVVSQVTYFLSTYVEFLASPMGLAYLGFEAALLGVALLLWAVDGFPGLAPSSFRADADPRAGS